MKIDFTFKWQSHPEYKLTKVKEISKMKGLQ